MERIILASGSPRRKELLTQVGIPFEVVVSRAEEIITKKDPGEIVKELSRCKAEAVARLYPKRIVLGADTIVVCEQEVLGKPKNEEDALRMIRLLQGRTHQVYTGVTLMCQERLISFQERADVQVVAMTEEEIEEYIRTGETSDKAGAYAIQGYFAKYISRIEGDYYTIMGLPVCRVYQELKKFI